MFVVSDTAACIFNGSVMMMMMMMMMMVMMMMTNTSVAGELGG